MQKIGNPMPLFLDASGMLADGGYLYVGVADGDPVTDPIDLFWDSDLTIPATQPIRTLGGFIVNGVTPASLFCAEADYSQRMEDSNHTLVFYSPSIFTPLAGFQPLSSELTAIAALSTTSFGRNLLTLANSAALATQTGIPAPVPLTGSTAITGSLGRQGAGVFSYWYDPAMTGGRIFEITEGDPLPAAATQPGDVVWVLAP